MQPSAARLAFNTYYPFLVWAFTILLPAGLFFITETIQHDWRSGLFSGGITLFLGILFSLPALFFNLIICPKIAESNIQTRQAKGSILAIGLGFIAATWSAFALLSNGLDTELFLIGFSTYGTASLIAGAVFPLRRRP